MTPLERGARAMARSTYGEDDCLIDYRVMPVAEYVDRYWQNFIPHARACALEWAETVDEGTVEAINEANDGHGFTYAETLAVGLRHIADQGRG